METIQALNAWKKIAMCPVMLQHNTTRQRIKSVYNSLYKVLDGSLNPKAHKTLKVKNSSRTFRATYSKIAYKEALKNAYAVLEYLEEEVLFNPTQYWSNTKRKEVQHFITDTITYIIEDTEAELNKLA